MTDTNKYRNASLKNEVYTAGHLLARRNDPRPSTINVTDHRVINYGKDKEVRFRV